MKIYISIIFLLFCCNAHGQEPMFIGIGVFKVKSDTSSLYHFVKDENLKIKDINTVKQYDKEISKGKTMIRLHFKKGEYFIHDIEKCPDVREYFLPYYKVDDILFKNIRLLYYKGKLEVFESDWNKDAIEAIELKYGKIRSQTFSDTSTCVYKYTGNERKLIGYTYIKEKYWGIVTLTSSFNSTFDGDCNETTFSYFKYELGDNGRSQCHWSQEIPLNKLDKNKLKDF